MLKYYESKQLADSFNIPLHKDFHGLGSDVVESIIRAADFHRYRKPPNANGSRARYFYAYLCRSATVKPRMPR
jgi:hypothetical protein